MEDFVLLKFKPNIVKFLLKFKEYPEHFTKPFFLASVASGSERANFLLFVNFFEELWTKKIWLCLSNFSKFKIFTGGPGVNTSSVFLTDPV